MKVRGRKELSEIQDGLPGGARVSWKAPRTVSFWNYLMGHLRLPGSVLGSNKVLL